MEIDEWAIGQRIANHRARRGLTQDELAGLVGISLSMMKKIESGDRQVTRFSQLVQFAQVLRVKDLRELTGVPLSLMPDGHRGHPAAAEVRAAMMDRGRVVGEAPNLDELARGIERAWRSWQAASAFRYAMVSQQLPALIRQCESATRAHRGGDRRRALRETSKLYQLVRTWTKRVGEHELSYLAADRAVTAALDADDPDLSAAAAWNLAMILSAQGKTEPARGVVYRAIDELRPYLDDAGPARLAVFGGLHLMGATEAAREDNADQAHRLLEVADGLAARVGETNHFRIVFGPTNVALHRVSTAVELGRTGEALELAERVAIEASPAVERRLTYHLDSARAYARKHNDIAAVHMMQRVHRDSPEELHFNVIARETLRQLMGRAKPAVLPDLRPLLAAANLPD
ncbi:helix-turn-helix domain-containing protein [Rugosimonospora africana]|uniref:Transcriptional regulator n=1 Tax=Rugosimonospora africana TaxID=556532 RepID=A0A8J3QK63_9ACTN|nr:helix-turn-helix transcriptional regulator [Rugosimonospora africana]GIH12480.1 transcriptional regulator [Rugosimonospora africana]